MTALTITLRPATADDLPAINRVIEAAVMSWELPERVKRLSLSSYRYDALDLAHLSVRVAVALDGSLLGVAAWEPAADRDCPAGNHGVLLHGLYVGPHAWRQGIGGRLLDAAADAARRAGMDGLLVKAQADALGFFARRGLQPLPVEDPARHYADRYWLSFSDDGEKMSR